MTSFNGTAADDTFVGGAADDVFNYGSVVYNGSTVVGAQGFDTLSSGGGFDTLNFANLGIDHLFGERVGSDFRLHIQPTADGDDENPTTTLGGVTISNFYAADGNGVIDRINFADAYLLASYQGGVSTIQIFDPSGVRIETDIVGGTGNDSLTGSSVKDLLDGGAGNDTLTGLGGDDELLGGAGVDRLYGGDGKDELSGHGGNDLLNGGPGIDTMVGGTGNDRYVISRGGETIIERAGEGTDTVTSSVSFTLGSALEHLTLSGTGSTDGQGNGASNRIAGNDANNTLTGLAGNDTLDGGSGFDHLLGGAGNDSFVVEFDGDLVTELASEGSDTVLLDKFYSSYQYVLPAHVENATKAIDSVDEYLLTGNAGANVLTGSSLRETLDGAGGNDRLVGLGGIDWYHVDSVDDVVVEAAGQGDLDHVWASVSYTLPAHVESLQVSGGANLNATGNAGPNGLTGSWDDNVLDGAGGADTMWGYGGDDTFIVDDPGDIVIEINDEDGLDTVISGVTYALAIRLENLTLTGSAAISGIGSEVANRIIGNGAANRLTGGAGNDTLVGGSGNDLLDGGTGNDRLEGGSGVDTFRFSSALNGSTNVDMVQRFAAADDALQLENNAFTRLTATGPLASAFFRAHRDGTAADANDFIVYETDTGNLYYDADGSGVGAKLWFAFLAGAPVVSAADIFVI